MNQNTDISVFRVIMQNNEQIFELYAKKLYESELWDLVVVEDFVFDDNPPIPFAEIEAKIGIKLTGVTRSYIPINSIVRIDEISTVSKDDVKPQPQTGTKILNLPHPFNRHND